MEDFYAPLRAEQRPQVLALTASPDGMVPAVDPRHPAKSILEANLHCTLLTAQDRCAVDCKGRSSCGEIVLYALRDQMWGCL